MRLLFLFFAVPAFGADLGSPVPMPTGDNAADVRAIAGYLKEQSVALREQNAATAAILTDLSAQLAALKADNAELRTRITAGERFAAKAGYVPPVVSVPVAYTPPLGVAGGPPTMRGTPAPSAVTSPPPTPGPGSYAVTSGPIMYTSAPRAAPRGGTGRGPLGFGILPKLLGGYGCGGSDPTPEYRPAYYSAGRSGGG